MTKFVEISQIVARAINHTTWEIPRIRDGDGDKWRNIRNDHLVVNTQYVNGHDKFGNAIFRAKKIMAEKGWNTEISTEKEICHEHLLYQTYYLIAWK